MKSVIVTMMIISSMLVNTAYAGDRYHGDGLNPLWIPVAIFSTLAAVAIAESAPPVYEHRHYYEPRRTIVYEEPRQRVIYEEPRYYRYYDREPSHHYREERYRSDESPRYRDYR